MASNIDTLEIAEVVQLSPSGNRCDHDPKNPRLELDYTPNRRGKLPAVITKCLENLQAYYYDRSILRPLAELDVSDKKVTAGKRSNRSEAREAEVLVISAILHCMDLTSLLVGVPNSKLGFVHRSTYELAKMAGLLDPITDEPHRRFTRCLSRIRRSGMMETTRTTFKTAHGTVRAGTAIKKVSDEFIVMLMGGTEKDRAALAKSRAGHYAKTKEVRVKTRQPTMEHQRDTLADKLIAQAKAKAVEGVQRKAAKAGATEAAIEALNPLSKQEAYNKARASFQRDLINNGLDFHAMHSAMNSFPKLEQWTP